jgi:hypothetical protein
VNAGRRSPDPDPKIGCPPHHRIAIERPESVALGSLHYSPRFLENQPTVLYFSDNSLNAVLHLPPFFGIRRPTPNGKLRFKIGGWGLLYKMEETTTLWLLWQCLFHEKCGRNTMQESSEVMHPCQSSSSWSPKMREWPELNSSVPHYRESRWKPQI